MLAMQYRISLPADYDMEIIRRRVAERGHMLNGFAGLALKAWCIRVRGTAGSAANEYAPFYLWASPAGMARFMWEGGGFGAVVASFGRPAAETWITAASIIGGANGSTPVWATRSGGSLPRDTDPQHAVASLAQSLAELSASNGLHSAVLAVNTADWTWVRFALWQQCPAGTGTDEVFEVLRLTVPQQEA